MSLARKIKAWNHGLLGVGPLMWATMALEIRRYWVGLMLTASFPAELPAYVSGVFPATGSTDRALPRLS